MKNNYRKYLGKNIDIYYNVAICEHAGECFRRNPLVFEVARKSCIIPDNGDVASNQSVINRCPSWALKYLAKEKN